MEELEKQLICKEIGIRDGIGSISQLYEKGPFVLYSRTSANDTLAFIQTTKHIEHLDEMKTIFLLGPTPKFFGEDRASTSWRRSFVDYVKNDSILNDDFLIVLPEPASCNWKDVDYGTLSDPMDQIYGQLHWEDYFINLAARSGVLVLHSHFRWSGNAGPTARCEAGKLFALMTANRINAAVVNLPEETQTCQYINAHLLDALSLFNQGKFALTKCSPVALNENKVPIDRDNKVLDAGIYPDGSIESGNLDEFFAAIIRIATK